MSDAKLNSCLNLMRRMPPSATENSLAGLIELAPELTDDLLTNIDQPLKLEKDTEAGQDFVLCDYNRDGDSYRSPWSNKYYPDMDDGFLPSQKLRTMESVANRMMDTYRKLYFEGGTSSVYFFDTDEEGDGFGACFLVHKEVPENASMKKGWWDSTHVFEVAADGDSWIYKLTTTVMISIVLQNDKVGNVDLSGLRTIQMTKKMKIDKFDSHVSNMGSMLEQNETRIRNEIEGIYIQKTRTIINGIRSATTQRDALFSNIAAELNAGMLKKS